MEELYKVIGQRDVEIEWIKKICSSWTYEERKKLIVPSHLHLSVSRQARILGMSRASCTTNRESTKLTLQPIDRLFTAYPFYGVPKMQAALNREYGITIGRDHTRRLMRLMGLEAVYPKKSRNTSIPDKQHAIYPYLLRGVAAQYPNHT